MFPVAHVLHEQYIRLKEEGDIGEYKRLVKSLFQILDKIIKKCDAIEKAVTTIQNANDGIKDETVKAKRLSTGTTEIISEESDSGSSGFQEKL